MKMSFKHKARNSPDFSDTNKVFPYFPFIPTE